MSITVECSCGEAIEVRDEFAGRLVRCPGCRKRHTVRRGRSDSGAPKRSATRRPSRPRAPRAAARRRPPASGGPKPAVVAGVLGAVLLGSAAAYVLATRSQGPARPGPVRAPARDREPASVAWEADVREPSVAREVRQLRARNVRERTAAARALATMGPRAKEAVPALLAAMARRSSGIEFEMAVDRTLRAIGAAAVPDLVDALRDGDAERRFYAARALMKIGPAAAEAVPALVHTLENDPDYGVRANAAAALGDMGPRAAPAVPALRRAAGNPRAPITHDTAQGQLRVRAQMALDRIERPPPPP